MRLHAARYFSLIIAIIISAGCANIVPPQGGAKDETPPKLLLVNPGDSLLNTKVSKIELRYDEFISLADQKEIQVSPLLPFPLTVVVAGKKATITIPDTLLDNNTTYRISFGRSIVDIHEGNPISPYTYVFSTGSYFDSLQLNGQVIDAATGREDTGILILLYPAEKSDSAIVREKPLYVGRTTGGRFAIDGLPGRRFRIYALKDANSNMVYDGLSEKVAFIDSIVYPTDTAGIPIVLKVFAEKIDTGDVVATDQPTFGSKRRANQAKVFNYNVLVDTVDISKRTMDVTKPLTISFTRDIDSLNSQRMSLAYDSVLTDTTAIEVQVPFTADTDTVKTDVIYINTAWKENTVYTLRLLKGFIKDSAGNDAMPSRYKFRTRSDDDYSKLHIHLPAKYDTAKYVLLVKGETDTIHMKPIADTVVHLVKLQPGRYDMFIIEDANGNGIWDTGDLLGKKQPENVIPFTQPMQLKAGWDNTFDFEPEAKKPKMGKDQSPEKRDTGFGK